MSDKCFLCLNNCRTRRCAKCKVKAHRDCWTKYKKSTRYYPYKANQCPQCRSNIKTKRYNTRLNALSKKRVDCMYTVKDLLERVDRACGREQKMYSTKQLFEYLYQNMWFINRHKNFRKSVRNKLVELATIERWEYAEKMHLLMFGEPV